MIIGKLDLSPPIPPALVAAENEIEPLTIPVPFDTSLLSNVKFVIVPPAYATVISVLCNVR